MKLFNNKVVNTRNSLTALSMLAGAVYAAEKPNFIVILLDDVGYADFGCFGGAIPTPNIDALAQQGVRMSQMYNCARSCPTRASLLTGLYPQQAGIGYMTGNGREKYTADSYQGYLNRECVTLAEFMGANDYFTAMTGKWHVGPKPEQSPAARGFDRSLSATAGGFYFPDSPKTKLFLDGEVVKSGTNGIPKEWYSTDLWTDFSLKFINEAHEQKKPFMLYLAYNAAHFPLQAPKEEVDKFKGQFAQGWDQMRSEVYERQVRMGLLGDTYSLTPRNPKIPKWDQLSAQQKAQSEHIMEIYAATISKVDQNIGRLIDQLKQKGLYDNTFIILLSDNGGNAEGRTVFGTYKGEDPGSVNSTVFLGQAWAETSNTPFFLYKHHTHEGGIASPCIVSYPAGISAKRNGSIIHTPAHVIDIMATIAGISKATYPMEKGGEKIKPMEGENLLPYLTGAEKERKSPIFWEHEGNIALRMGDWKLVKEAGESEFSLFNMKQDRTELHDRSKSDKKQFVLMKDTFDRMFKEKEAHLYPGKDLRWYVSPCDYGKPCE